MLRHYNDLLEPNEVQEYKSKMLKTMYSLLCSVCLMPYVGYQLVTLNKDYANRRPRLVGSLALQFAVTLLNVRWSRQFAAFESSIQNKYLDHLPEEQIKNFKTSYLPWYLQQRAAMQGLQVPPVPVQVIQPSYYV